MIKEFFVSLLHYFVNITAAVLIVTAIYLTISGQPMDSAILWEILLSGLITALPSAVLVCLDIKSGRIVLLLWLVHFLLIFLISLLLIGFFGWYKITALSVLLTFPAIVFIYLYTCFAHYLVDRRHAALMNQKLKQRYSKMNKN